jgi:hypothetical protein
MYVSGFRICQSQTGTLEPKTSYMIDLYSVLFHKLQDCAATESKS